MRPTEAESFSSPSRRLVRGGSVLALLLLFLLWWQATGWYAGQLVAGQRAETAVDIALRGNTLAALLNRRFARLQALTAFVETLPAASDAAADFVPFAGRLYAETRGVQSFVLTPEGQVRSVYPLVGGESWTEWLLDEALVQARVTQQTLRSGRIVVTGPLELPDGHPGLLARQAVVRSGLFWGYTGIVVDLGPLLEEAGLGLNGAPNEDGMAYALRDETGRVFWGDPRLFGGDPIASVVPVQEGNWELIAAPPSGWLALVRPALLPFQLTSLVVVFLMVGLVYLVLGRQASLQAEVVARTQALARANARLEARVVRRTRELALLLETAQQFTATLAREPLLDLILEKLAEKPGYTMAALYVVGGAPGFAPANGDSKEPGDLRLLQSDGPPPPPPEWPPLAQVMADRHPLRRWGDPGKLDWLLAPLLAGDRVIGVLVLAHENPGHYEEHDAALVLALATHAALALENARLYEQAQSLAVLEERQRLARDLHDSVSQALYGIALGARTAQERLARSEPAEATAALDYILPLAEAALAEMRSLIFELRPESLEREGLAAALERQAVAIEARYGVAVVLDLCEEPPAPLALKETLYRVAQEALNNVARHAGAEQVWVQLDCRSRSLGLEIRDDGRGFDMSRDYPGHLGLHSMRERVENAGGRFLLESAPGEGTTVRAQVPLPG